MQFKIQISPLGDKITLIAQEGTYEEAKLAAARLMEQLKAGGVQIDVVSQPEQHRHDDEKVHVHGGNVHAH